MRRIGALIVATAALAVGAAPAYALEPGLPDVGATAGDALALAGNGGAANTGNVQVLNGNSVAVGLGDKAEAEGGNTSAQSGDAYGGDGGNAKAIGGDAKSSTKHEHSYRGEKDRTGHDGSGDDRRKEGDRGPYDKGGDWKDKGGHSKDEGRRSKDEGGAPPKAVGGEAAAIGGDGGFANTGNLQFGNGNALALSLGKKLEPPKPAVGGKGLPFGGGYGHDGAEAEGGDTCAESGDAYGGDGGNAFARGGDALAEVLRF